MKVKLTDTRDAQRLWEDLAWTLSCYGNAKVEGESVILNARSVIKCVIHRIVETFEIELKVSPNIAISGINDIPVYIYPRYLLLPSVENLRILLVGTILEASQAVLVLARLVDMGLLKSPKYIGIVINIDRDGDKYKPVSNKVMVAIKDIGYEIVTTGRRVTYRVTFSKFDLFKDFVDVILPEFLENRSEVRE